MTLHGDTAGLKTSQRQALEALYACQAPPRAFAGEELVERMAALARALSRRLGVLVDRRGRVDQVLVGDAHRLTIPDPGRARSGARRLRGLRLIVADLQGGGLTPDELTALRLMHLDAAIAIRVGDDGAPGAVEVATLLPPDERGDAAHRLDHRAGPGALRDDFLAAIQELEDRFGRASGLRRVAGRPRAVLVGVGPDADAVRAAVAELGRLADAAGLEVADAVFQFRRRADPRLRIGRGKLREVLDRARALDAQVLLFDGELNPSQMRNVATETELRVLDRTQLILDIFARRARTREGKLQVEIAQLRYRRPRLAIMPTAMSRLAGGIGGKGPGESKLEINRRLADQRLARLTRELKKLGGARARRRRPPAPRRAEADRAGGLHQRGQVHPAQPAHPR